MGEQMRRDDGPGNIARRGRVRSRGPGAVAGAGCGRGVYMDMELGAGCGRWGAGCGRWGREKGQKDSSRAAATPLQHLPPPAPSPSSARTAGG